MKSLLLKTEIIGIGVIAVLGTLMHFVFEWSGDWPPLGVFAAVNESVFEHLKMTFWPTVAYAAATYGILSKHTGNFFVAKAAGLYVMPLVILVLFYGYTAFTGSEVLLIDIIIFVIAVISGQLASYAVMKASPLPSWLPWLAIALAAILGAVYAVFTFYPPHTDIFISSEGHYGIH